MGWAFVKNRSNDLIDVLSQVHDDRLDPSAWMQQKIKLMGKTRTAVVRKARLNTTYGYQIIAGTRKGTRDKLLQLAFGMDLSLEDTNELLERNGLSRLRQSSKRDVAIAFCRSRQMNIRRCDETLVRAGIKPIMPESTSLYAYFDDVYPRDSYISS